MQLQVTIADIEYCIKNPVQIGVQYSNPIERAIRRDFRLSNDVSVEAYINQATISWPPRTRDSNRTYIVFDYPQRNGDWILFCATETTNETWQRYRFAVVPLLSFDLCVSRSNIIYHNLITKQHLKDFYKYCED